MSLRVAVLGGGLAGLSCAYELAQAGAEVTVLEREPYPGGMAMSFVDESDGEYWTYDFGPHRFHTTDPELIEHVSTVLAGNVRQAQRLSRIRLGGRFYDYPLNALNVLRNLPPLTLVRSFTDYAWVRITQRLGITHYSDENFEGWVTKRFGRTLYNLFFGVYTGKSWKMSPKEISGDWASQRISQLDLVDAVKKTLVKGGGDATRSLVRNFIYPARGGIGEIARGYVREIQAMGSTVITDAPITRVHRDGDRVTGVSYGGSTPGTVEADHYISTIPITALARAVRPAAPKPVLDSIGLLQYVSIIFIYLKLARPSVSPDSWVYLPETHLTIHRISEFKNFSPQAAPADKTMVCAEITCRIGDEHWRASEEELVAIATSDLEQIDFIAPGEVLGAFVKRIPHAYPVYDLQYKDNLTPVLEFVHSLQNIKTGGRQGLFRYNNMDQSIDMGRKMAWSTIERRDAGHEAVATESEYFG
ncbi:MAG TPA: FAD-dependent oxidoreductase [Solirubrobacteraceae bacterium]|jgi:protoporphyrinogen oxidase|nr:FAD-dependent oxidoreductase [Solirubrobacteraceae bacterium]